MVPITVFKIDNLGFNAKKYIYPGLEGKKIIVKLKFNAY